MATVEYWSSLKHAWQATRDCEITPIAEAVGAPAKMDNSWQLIKSESRVRLILIDPEPPQTRLVLKIYRIPFHLAWRTFGMVSRANREFTALMEAHRRGLAVVRPINEVTHHRLRHDLRHCLPGHGFGFLGCRHRRHRGGHEVDRLLRPREGVATGAPGDCAEADKEAVGVKPTTCAVQRSVVPAGESPAPVKVVPTG